MLYGDMSTPTPTRMRKLAERLGEVANAVRHHSHGEVEAWLVENVDANEMRELLAVAIIVINANRQMLSD
jgi:NTP pyrophosphatase (non-canonical NTP hydrolase)